MMFNHVTRAELAVMLVAARGAVAELETIERKSKDGCSTCYHYRKYIHGVGAGPACALASGAEIPADVLPQGCPSWQTDSIPF